MNNRISKGLFWSYGERILAQIVGFIVSIVLARLILPEEFGLVSLIMIFIDICNVFVTSGLGSGLIQKKEADDIDFSTVFWLSLLLGCVVYILLFIIAPTIERFFQYGSMTGVIRILGLRLILASINTIQHAYVSRKMIFKQFFFSTLFGTVISAVVGIFLALKGFGVWALVAQYLTNTTIDTVFLAFSLDWHPRLVFKIERIRFFFDFGWKILAAAMIDNLYTNLRSFIIGKRYTSSDLAFYNKGMQFPAIIVTNINSSIIRVMFPALSAEQNDKTRMRNMVKRSVQVSSFLLSPLLVGLMIIAKPLVLLLLTEKWVGCVNYIYIFCVTYLFMPIHAINEQAIKATGHSEVTLTVEILKKIFGIILIFISIITFDNAVALAASFLMYSFAALIINSYPGKKLYEYGFLEQLKDVFVSLSLSIAMGIVIFPMRYLIHFPLILIILQILAGCCVYIGLSVLTHNNSYYYVFQNSKRIISHRKVQKH